MPTRAAPGVNGSPAPSSTTANSTNGSAKLASASGDELDVSRRAAAPAGRAMELDARTSSSNPCRDAGASSNRNVVSNT